MHSFFYFYLDCVAVHNRRLNERQSLTLPRASITCKELPQLSITYKELLQLSITYKELPQLSITYKELPQLSITYKELPQLPITCKELPQLSITCKDYNITKIAGTERKGTFCHRYDVNVNCGTKDKQQKIAITVMLENCTHLTDGGKKITNHKRTFNTPKNHTVVNQTLSGISLSLSSSQTEDIIKYITICNVFFFIFLNEIHHYLKTHSCALSFSLSLCLSVLPTYAKQ